jgi:hypothetical protein
MRYAAVVALLLLASCSKLPDHYSPPAERPAARVLAAGELSHFTTMDSAGAANHIVSGVLDGGEAPWRWCEKQAVLQFKLPETRGLRFRADIAISEMTFAQTGPVRIDVAIDGKRLDTIVYDKPESRTTEFDVPEEMVTTVRPVVVTLTADKEWAEAGAGVKRGFILTSAGFVQ